MNLVKIKTSTGDARMHKDVAPKFDQLREIVKQGSGVDFLAVCGDVLRDPTFKSKKDGVANRSWHKTGRAFDYDQTSRALVIVSEPRSGKQFFRTYLLCAKQDGSLGEKKTVRDYRGGSTNAWLFDFTAAAERLGWQRIPAWNGWQKNYNRREFWHYQITDGLTWDAAMQQIKGGKQSAVSDKQMILGLNDRGDEVRALQTRLSQLTFLPAREIDGVYGTKTKLAVELFQRANGLSIDGMVGPITRKALGL